MTQEIDLYDNHYFNYCIQKANCAKNVPYGSSKKKCCIIFLKIIYNRIYIKLPFIIPKANR